MASQIHVSDVFTSDHIGVKVEKERKKPEQGEGIRSSRFEDKFPFLSKEVRDYVLRKRVKVVWGSRWS